MLRLGLEPLVCIGALVRMPKTLSISVFFTFSTEEKIKAGR